jgi:aspartyl-tRNA(Asn)/glutamyl-tRNA(Gln) amidotransferase subunit A
MKEKDLIMMSIKEISSMIKKKQISPVEIVEECVNRTKKLQPELNAYITFLEEEAKKKAKIAEREIMKEGPKSPLHGIPIALKDLFYTKGVLTSAGSKLLKDFKPDYDGTITDRLNKSGAILMGKTNMHEFAFGPTNEDSYYGSSKNPWDTSRITGGSSGGSAIAVATGMVYMGMGTDTGGSVRIPAAFCGVVGFKPTFGMGSLYGIIPLSFTLDHPGPLTRSVYDAAITMDIITGYDPKDPSIGKYKGGNTNLTEGLRDMDNVKGMTIGIPSNFYFDKVDYEVEKLVKNAISNLKQLGAEIKTIEIPYLDIVPDISTIIMFSEAAYNHKDRLAVYPDEYKSDVKARLDQGMKYSAIEYISALQQREKILNAWNKVISEVDVVVTPTLPIPAFKIGSKTVVSRGKEEPAREMCVRHTRFANTTGCPALSVPCGLTPEGLPAGLMIMGRNYDDFTVLKIGYAYEKHYSYKFKQF